MAAQGLGFLGVELDEVQNSATSADSEVSGPKSRVAVVVVQAREDLEIAAQVRARLDDSSSDR